MSRLNYKTAIVGRGCALYQPVSLDGTQTSITRDYSPQRHSDIKNRILTNANELQSPYYSVTDWGGVRLGGDAAFSGSERAVGSNLVFAPNWNTEDGLVQSTAPTQRSNSSLRLSDSAVKLSRLIKSLEPQRHKDTRVRGKSGMDTAVAAKPLHGLARTANRIRLYPVVKTGRSGVQPLPHCGGVPAAGFNQNAQLSSLNPNSSHNQVMANETQSQYMSVTVGMDILVEERETCEEVVHA